MDLELWETGGRSALATLASGVSVSSDSGQVASGTWDASLLATSDASAVELRVVGHASADSGNERAVEVGAVEWDAAHEVDGPGLYFLRARYYDSGTGRFLSRDPIEFSQRYAYVGNNPVLFIDPTGMCFQGLPCPPLPIGIQTPPPRTLQHLYGGLLGIGCDRMVDKEGIMFHYACPATRIHGSSTFGVTVGDNVYSSRSTLRWSQQVHEACHVGQYDRFGSSAWNHGPFLGGAYETQADYFEDFAELFPTLTEVRRICSGEPGAGDPPSLTDA